MLEECAVTAAELLSMGAVGRHDLAGRIFNRLIAERKLLAAYYTSIPGINAPGRTGLWRPPTGRTWIGAVSIRLTVSA